MKKLTRVFFQENRKLLRIFRHPTFLYLTILGNSFLILATLAVYYLEKDTGGQINSYFDAFWWGVSTITTVAYGDILPQTFWGRVIGIVLMYTGTVFFISFTGVLLTILLKGEVEEEIAPLQRELLEEEASQEKMEKSLKEILTRLERIERQVGGPR